MLDFILNKTIYRNKYRTHSEAVIVSCYFNSEKSPYRLKAFKTWYNSIKHLNYRIIECVIGDGASELDFLNDKNITVIRTKNLLWHKETLLNKIVSTLPNKFKYVFWVDADVLFTNLDWMVNGVKELQVNNLIQPFEYCAHLERDDIKPRFNMGVVTLSRKPNRLNSKVWRSFSANFADNINWNSENYNDHGHVGFAWGAKREILQTVPLFEKALIGGADHIIAHAAVGQIPCNCITKAFTDDIDEINKWSQSFGYIVNKKVGYVKGHLYHIWHGDIEKRQYLKRIQDFTKTTKEIINRDENGLFKTKSGIDDVYIKKYFKDREVTSDFAFSGSTSLNREISVKSTKTVTRPIMKKTVYENTGSCFIPIEVNALVESNIDYTVEDSVVDNDMTIDTFDGFDGGTSGGGGVTNTWEDNNTFS